MVRDERSCDHAHLRVIHVQVPVHVTRPDYVCNDCFLVQAGKPPSPGRIDGSPSRSQVEIEWENLKIRYQHYNYSVKRERVHVLSK